MANHVADAKCYLVITRIEIQDIKIIKKAMVWPAKVSIISICLFDVEIILQAMMIEKLQFS